MPILSDSAIICAENCPKELKDAGNELWNFMGEVRNVNELYHYVTCGKCNKQKLYKKEFEIRPRPPVIITLAGYCFITEDMLDVTIYWGRCNKCKGVYWIRQGPPFQYLRSYVGVQV